MNKGKFTGYTKSGDLDRIKHAFEKRHGYKPSKVVDGGSIWLVGPLRSDEPAEPVALQPALPGMGEQ